MGGQQRAKVENLMSATSQDKCRTCGVWVVVHLSEDLNDRMM